VRVLGVDPGLTGAFAVIETSLDLLLVWDMPVALSGTGSRKEVIPVFVADIVRDTAPDVCFIERVGAMPKQGVSSVFSFGRSYGVVLGVLGALRVPVHLIAPAQWKRTMKLGQDKAAARAMAVRLFPDAGHYFTRVRDHDRAEAALIAACGLMTVRDGTNKTG
jgi:crossover junction endodeoxyribonuclease RuvC